LTYISKYLYIDFVPPKVSWSISCRERKIKKEKISKVTWFACKQRLSWCYYLVGGKFVAVVIFNPYPSLAVMPRCSFLFADL